MSFSPSAGVLESNFCISFSTSAYYNYTTILVVAYRNCKGLLCGGRGGYIICQLQRRPSSSRPPFAIFQPSFCPHLCNAGQTVESLKAKLMGRSGWGGGGTGEAEASSAAVFILSIHFPTAFPISFRPNGVIQNSTKI